jgi:RNA polymerase sigma-70 factor, ECF subfamily
VAEDGTLLPESPPNGPLPEADAHLLAQLREGDAEAGHRFVRDYYPAVYRYLLYLTGHRETAEDLAQETFLLAWRHLDQFQGRAPLRLWLHQIARREFLHTRRRRQPSTSLEAVAELPEPHAGDWTDEAVLRVLLHTLPEELREVVILHDLAGYTSREIAQIIRAPASTIRSRLGAARSRLAEELGPGDLAYLNEPSVPMRQWAWLPLDQMYALEARLSMGGTQRRESGAGDREAPGDGASQEEAMERREFLRQTAAGAVGLMLPDSEKEVVDSRLTQKVTLAFKGTSLFDLCEHVRAETGVHLAAGASVADEKVTLFCEKMPLRDVMRQLSRPFGYTWLRSRKAGGDYRYDLVQDLRSQLLEEELRNRDRNAALLALERDMGRYRPYLSLSPDEALARSKSAPPGEKHLLEMLAGYGWGPIQIYFRLSSQELAALRAGQELTFSAEPMPGEQPLPPDIARGVFQSFRDIRFRKRDDAFTFGPADLIGPGGLHASAVPEVRAMVTARIKQGELGHFWFGGHSGIFNTASSSAKFLTSYCQDPYAVGRSSHLLTPDHAVADAKLSHDPALRTAVNVHAQSSCRPCHSPGSSSAAGGSEGSSPDPKVTSADVLEALHQAAALPIVADYYTHLYQAGAVSVRNQPLFGALTQLSDTLRLRWRKDGAWLQFRSTSFYDDRIKEVPNRLLVRWADSRRQHGFLTLDDLCEIAQLSDAQLDAVEMAEGARECFGLDEWDLARNASTRPHLRFLGGFTPAQRQEAMSATGLAFTKMSLTQQQQFISLALVPDPRYEEPLQSLEELAGAALRVEYTQPGWFQWGDPGLSSDWTRWVVPIEPGRHGRRALRPPVRERTREAALQALRRLDPEIREVALHSRSGLGPQSEAAQAIPLETQIFPTELGLTITYFPGTSNARLVRVLHDGINTWHGTW